MKRFLFLLPTIVVCAFLAAAEKAPKQPKADPPKASSGTVQVHISLGDLLQAQPSLKKLFAFDLPVKTAWAMRVNVSAVDTELRRFEEQRQSLFKKYGKPEVVEGPRGAVKAANQLIVPVENMPAFSEDFKTLTEITVDLSIVPIPLEQLGDDVKLSAADMLRLEPFLIP